MNELTNNPVTSRKNTGKNNISDTMRVEISVPIDIYNSLVSISNSKLRSINKQILYILITYINHNNNTEYMIGGIQKTSIRGKEKERSDKKYRINFDWDAGTFTGITESDIQRWELANPAVDVRLELLRAQNWVIANPSQRKKNYMSFITRWMSRCQDRGGNRVKDVTVNTNKSIERLRKKK